MKIVVMPFIQRKGNRVGKAAVKFDDFCGAGPCTFVGFTICDDKEKGQFVLFPSSIVRRSETQTRPYFFLRPDDDTFLDNLQDKILDIYDSMTGGFKNGPRLSVANQPVVADQHAE